MCAETCPHGSGRGKRRESYLSMSKVHNLKQMAKTLIYLQEHKLDDYDILREKSSQASMRFNEISGKIRSVDEKLAANANLQKQIVTYAKTRDVYAAYKKAGYSKKFKALHEADILLHQTAKKAFDEVSVKKIPTVASLRTEYAKLFAEKKSFYRDYYSAKSEMKEILVAKSNIDSLYKTTDKNQERNLNEPSL